jgi:hypothetical protein
MTLTHLTMKSSNKKTGPIPVSTGSFKRCPDTCPFKSNGCYAGSGPLALHWRKVTEGQRGDDWDSFLIKIAGLPEGQLWRHHQAGDILDPGTDDGRTELEELTVANRGRRGWTYTHHQLTPYAVESLKAANADGFTVNASCESLVQADAAMAAGLPAVAVVPSDYNGGARDLSPAGNRVIQCPATRSDKVTCETCRLCQNRPDDVIIAFPAHGTGKKKAEAAIAAAVG